MPEFPDGTVADSASPSRPRFRIPWRAHFGIAALFLTIVAITVAYNYIMRPAFLEPLIRQQFAAGTNGTIDLKIEQASLFRGFRLKQVVVHAPAGYSSTPLFQAKEITLLYNLYGFFRGKFGVHEIALKEPQIHLERRNNILSLDALLKPSAKKAEEPKKAAGKPKISWFFDIQLFARVLIDKLNFTLDGRDKSNRAPEYAHVKNFSLNFYLLTRDFNHVDKTDYAGLISLLNALVIDLNAQQKIDVAYEDARIKVNSPLQLSWLLFYDGQSRKPEFISRMQIGQDKFPVTLRRGAPQNLAFQIDHRAEYDAKADQFKLDSFNIRFLGDTLLALSGEGEKVLTSDRTIRLSTSASRMNLGRVHDIVSQLTGNRELGYSGFFSVKPTKLTVHNRDISDEGGVRLERVSFRKGNIQISIPSLDFDHSAQINTALKPIPLKQARAKLRGGLNGAAVSLDAELEASRKTSINLSVRGLNPSAFTAGQLQGGISTVFTASGDSPQNLAIALRVFSPQLNYYIDRGKSGINRIDFNVRGNVKSNEDFSENDVKLPLISFSNKDRDYKPALELKSHLQLSRGENMHVVYSLDAFTVYFKELIGTLPAAQQESVGVPVSIWDPGRTMRADGETAVTIAGDDTAVIHQTQVALPDAHVDDVVIKAKARISPPYTHIDQFSITGLRQALSVGVAGTLKDTYEMRPDAQTGVAKRTAVKSPDLKYNVSISRPEEAEIVPNTYLIGDLSITGTAKGDIIAGLFKITELNFRNAKVRIDKANLDFPFKHDLRLKKSLNLRAGNKERIIKNYNFNKPYNFTIRGVDIQDPNNSREWLRLIYSRGNYPAIGASLEYKDNVFIMPVMQLYTLNGVVTVSDTMMNFGRFNPPEMEYSSTIQIKDIDLKQLMKKDKAATITDGKLRIDMLFTGNHFDKLIFGYRMEKFLENLSGYISVFRIGPEFAQMVMRALKPDTTDIVSSIAGSTARPQRIDIDIKEGFVYTHVPMQRGVVGTLLLAPGEYTNRRINVPEFFQRISNEASIYTSSGAAHAN